MKIFDFNIHLPCKISTDVNEKILYDNEMKLNELEYCYSHYKPILKESIYSGNFMLFNQNIFFENDLSDFIKKVKKEFSYSFFTALIDFRKQNVYEYLDIAVSNGIEVIKFHSYNQQITEENFSDIVKICKYAQEKKLIICIDTSYGTSKMYDYDNLKLSCYLSDFITKAPIVLLHSGGLRIWEAMLLAEDKKNIFLDTSFSITYYKNSTKEQDFAYAYKKIGSDRILYGSDTPYIDCKKSINDIYDFFNKYKFSSNDISNILYDNAVNLRNFYE